jgi:hypothetical protein
MTGLGILIVIICFFAYFRKRSTRAQEAVDDRFWERENEANQTRKQNLDNLSYITIPLDKFPIGIYDDEKIKDFEDKLTSLSQQKIVNFEGRSNTDLKMEYGAANLEALMEYDANFESLCTTLADYGRALYDAGHADEAASVLEFGISAGSDISRNFLLLGSIYRERGDDASLGKLIETAQNITSPMKDSIIRQLNEMQPAV